MAVSIKKIAALNAFKGKYIINAIDESNTMLEIKNIEDSKTFNMKVSTFNANIESGKYTAHSDDSFDIKVEEKSYNFKRD